MSQDNADINQILSDVERAEARVVAVCKDVVQEVADQVYAESQELCPVSPTDPKHAFYIGTSGALRGSGKVSGVQQEGSSVFVEVSYTASYAAAVHERTGVNHQYPGAVNPRAQAKFLSVPILRWRYRLAAVAAKRIKEVLG